MVAVPRRQAGGHHLRPCVAARRARPRLLGPLFRIGPRRPRYACTAGDRPLSQRHTQLRGAPRATSLSQARAGSPWCCINASRRAKIKVKSVLQGASLAKAEAKALTTETKAATSRLSRLQVASSAAMTSAAAFAVGGGGLHLS